MDSNIQRSVRSLARLSVLAGTIALTTGRVAISADASGQQSPDSRAKQIQGAWVLHVSAHDCQTGAPEATFQSIVTFAQGGTLTNVTTGADAPTGGHLWRVETFLAELRGPSRRDSW